MGAMNREAVMTACVRATRVACPGWRACTVLYCWCLDSYDTIPPGRMFGCSWFWFLSQGMNVWCILHVPTPISQGTGRPRSLSHPATALQRRELFPRPMPTAPFSRGEPEMPEAAKPRIQSGALPTSQPARIRAGWPRGVESSGRAAIPGDDGCLARLLSPACLFCLAACLPSKFCQRPSTAVCLLHLGRPVPVSAATIER